MKLTSLLKSPRTWIVIAVLALVVGELTLRGLGFGRFVMTYSSARYGWRYPPGLEYVDAPSPVTVRINDHGFRDRDFGAARPEASVLRVAVIGNSVVWGGGGLAVEQRFDTLLAEKLRAELARRGDARAVETLNFALPGYAFEQSARIWEDEVRAFRPDVLLVPILPYDVRPMRAMQDAPRYPFSGFVRRSATRDWVQRSLFGGWGAGVSDQQRAVENAVRADPFAAEHAALWSAMLARIEGMHAAVASDSGVLVLISIPTLEDVLAARTERTAQRVGPWAASRGIAHIDALDDFAAQMQPLLAEIEHANVPWKALWQRGADTSHASSLPHAASSCFFFHDPDHLTPRGHAVLAACSARELVRLGAL